LVSLLGVSTWCLCHQLRSSIIDELPSTITNDHTTMHTTITIRSLNDAHYDRQRYTGWVRQCTTYMHTSITPIYIYIYVYFSTPGTIIHHQSSSIHSSSITNDHSHHNTKHTTTDTTHHSSLTPKKISLTSSSTLDTTSLIITHQKNFSHHHQHSTPFIIDHQSSIIIIEPQTPSISMPSLWTPKSPQNPYFRPLPPYPHPPRFQGPPGTSCTHQTAPNCTPNCTLKHHHSITIQSPSFIHHPSSFNHHHSFIIHHHSITIIHSSSSFNHLYITTLVNPTPNTITSYTSMVGYSGWCLRLVSQVGVSGWCLRLVSQVGVSGWCLRLVSQVGVSGWCLWEPQIWHLNK
jgi:hypothetical protein